MEESKKAVIGILMYGTQNIDLQVIIEHGLDTEEWIWKWFPPIKEMTTETEMEMSMEGTRKEVYLKAMQDGFVKASSMYIKPGTLIKLSTLLKEALNAEKERVEGGSNGDLNSVWEYDIEKEFITNGEGGSDEHYLWK